MSTENLWAKEYLCAPPQRTTAERAAEVGWLDYFVRCEEYDRAVCTGGFDRRGSIQPRYNYERSLSVAFARRCTADVRTALSVAGVTAETSEIARRWAGSLCHDDAKAALEYLTARYKETAL